MGFYEFFSTNNTTSTTFATIDYSTGDNIFDLKAKYISVDRLTCNLEAVPIFLYDEPYYVNINGTDYELVYQDFNYPNNGFLNPIYSVAQLLSIVNTGLSNAGAGTSIIYSPVNNLFTLNNPSSASILFNQNLKSLFGTFPFFFSTLKDPTGYQYYQLPNSTILVQEAPSTSCWSHWINLFVETNLTIGQTKSNFNQINSQQTKPPTYLNFIIDILYPYSSYDWYPASTRSVEFVPYQHRWVEFTPTAVTDIIVFNLYVQNHNGNRYPVPLYPNKSFSIKLKTSAVESF